MSTIDPKRREYLTAKFPDLTALRPMRPDANTQVRATDRAEQIIERVWGDRGGEGGVLFDPARVPALAERADAAAAEYHRRAASGELRWDTGDGLRGDYNPDAPAEQGVVRIWRVGTSEVDVVRERWRDRPGRRWGTVDYTVGMLEHLAEQLDYHDCADDGCAGDCDLRCNVNITKACGGPTRLLPVDRGTLVLLFRCCRNCEDSAGTTASTNLQIALMEVHERLADQTDPAWARTAPWWMRWRAAIRRRLRRRR
ncbi:hypothetical protein [Mycolicibacter sinensis]|uniref:hypothetical protein n=1 Tax=Mycolicibacter sinensis (strain JDM601) TaxID=875328 RepID=UPI0007E9BE7C|nr:hypothetical protein [Mycolicibacter sinensis]OBH17061.1 hypothetical protein A5694_04905 [Mycolicibacter sinensis]